MKRLYVLFVLILVSCNKDKERVDVIVNSFLVNPQENKNIMKLDSLLETNKDVLVESLIFKITSKEKVYLMNPYLMRKMSVYDSNLPVEKNYLGNTAISTLDLIINNEKISKHHAFSYLKKKDSTLLELDDLKKVQEIYKDWFERKEENHAQSDKTFWEINYKNKVKNIIIDCYDLGINPFLNASDIQEKYDSKEFVHNK